MKIEWKLNPGNGEKSKVRNISIKLIRLVKLKVCTGSIY